MPRNPNPQNFVAQYGGLLLIFSVMLFGCSKTETPSSSKPATESTPSKCASCPGCSSKPMNAFTSLEGSLDIAGGTAHIPVMEEAAKRIMTACPNIRITVAGGGSGVGVQKVSDGLVQIGNTGRALRDEEIKKNGLQSFAFAVDGVAVVVHPGNTVRDLSTSQIKDIFAGKITNWKDVGGKDSKIHLYTRDEASGTRDVFWSVLLDKGAVNASATVVPSNGAMKTAVAGDEQAIGYLSVGHVDQSAIAIKVDGIEPSQQNATNGTYKVTRKLYMNTKGTPTGLTKAFIDYIMGPQAEDIIRSKGYIPIGK